MSDLSLGAIVQTGVHVCNQFVPMHEGVIVRQSPDKTISEVDIGSHLGCAPIIRIEASRHLVKLEKFTSKKQ